MSLVKDNEELKRIWCPGCGLFTIEKIISEEMEKIGWDRTNTVLISGIGCTARITEYFNLDTMHVTHGRTIPVAEGIKLAKPDLNVVIISGDGDLLNIGGNHFLHGARRNTNIKIFCNHNKVYAMTGGQTAATTPRDMTTKTAPKGSTESPFKIKEALKASERFFFARTNTLDTEHFRQATAQSLKWEGFSFVEIISPCVSDLARRQGFNFREGYINEIVHS